MKRLCCLLPLAALVLGGAGQVNRREDACLGVTIDTVTAYIFDSPGGGTGRIVSGGRFVPNTLQYFNDPPVWACQVAVAVEWQPSGRVAYGYLRVHHRPDGTEVAEISDE